jgi:hypothetical protein
MSTLQQKFSHSRVISNFIHELTLVRDRMHVSFAAKDFQKSKSENARELTLVRDRMHVNIAAKAVFTSGVISNVIHELTLVRDRMHVSFAARDFHELHEV